MDRDINKIIKGLNRLYILQVVIEQGFQKSNIADINQGFVDSFIDEDTTFKVNYRSFPAHRRDN
jgi:hypothetical protein